MSSLRTLSTAALGAAALAGALVSALACASGTAGTASTPQSTQPVVIPPSRDPQWPVKTRENVDLWLHGFALLQPDSGGPAIPLFRRGYAEELTVFKNRANVLTQLDVNRDKLRAAMAGGRLVNAQFMPFYFASVEQMRGAIDRFIQANGSVQAARSQQETAEFAVLASYFPNGPDRAWLALFASSLWDEDAKFYHSYWTQQQRERANVIDSVQSTWRSLVRPRLSRFLNSTQQRDGDIILSLPLGGEGRTLNGAGLSRNAVVVTFPARPSDAQNAMYVIAHEMIGAIANTAIADNTTPAEQRNGTSDRYASAAAVRGGLMLMEKMVPELADGYARYYIT
ncbi:MAG TPA: hypothetical protein VGT98_15375, partial [Candidatus Elarobacter sp.]|nr:hypothetical protein [Candidatus Elarobacter sp.]